MHELIGIVDDVQPPRLIRRGQGMVQDFVLRKKMPPGDKGEMRPDSKFLVHVFNQHIDRLQADRYRGRKVKLQFVMTGKVVWMEQGNKYHYFNNMIATNIEEL